MNLQQLHCPTCAAPLQVSPDATTVRCPFCQAQISVERSQGEVTASLVNQMTAATAGLATEVTGAIAGSNAQVQAALAQSSSAAREEMRRSQLVQELSSVEMQLTTIQSEIRSVQRLPETAVTRKQMKELRSSEEALFARRTALQEALNPPPPPEQADEVSGGAQTQRVTQGWRAWLFGFKGRANRRSYWIGLAIGFVLLLIGSAFMPRVEPGETRATATILVFPGLILIAVSLWMWAAVSAKRYHDRNKSAWWVLIGLIPYVGWLWQLVELGFFPGTARANRFGPKPG